MAQCTASDFRTKSGIGEKSISIGFDRIRVLPNFALDEVEKSNSVRVADLTSEFHLESVTEVSFIPVCSVRG